MHFPAGQLHSDQPPSTGPFNLIFSLFRFIEMTCLDSSIILLTYRRNRCICGNQSPFHHTSSHRVEELDWCKIGAISESLLHMPYCISPLRSTETSLHQLIHCKINIKDKTTLAMPSLNMASLNHSLTVCKTRVKFDIPGKHSHSPSNLFSANKILLQKLSPVGQGRHKFLKNFSLKFLNYNLPHSKS